MEKTFVTGSLGFIGYHLVPYLKEQGYNILSCDLHLREYEDYLKSDVTSYIDLQRIFRNNKIESVIHMAGEVGRIMGELHPHKMIHVNAIGTLNLIHLCIEHNTKLIYFSTSEVYGKNLSSNRNQVIEEKLDSGSAFGCVNVYAISKLYAEALVKHYVENYDLKAVTIRPFMIYGEVETPSPYRSALVQFVTHALKNEALTVHKGTSRSWCHVSDFIKGVKLVLNQPFKGYYEAYNIGSEEYHSMKEAALMVIDETKSQSKIDLVDPPSKFLNLNKYFSIDKIKKLGYNPEVSLREGIKRMVNYYVKK